MIAACSFGICGTTGPDPRYNPGLVLREPAAQAIVLLLNGKPRSTAELAGLVPNLAARIHTGSGVPLPAAAAAKNPPPPPLPFEEALRRVVDLRAAAERDGLWHIGFPLLMAEDQETLRDSLEPFSQGLADLILGANDRIDAALAPVIWRRPLPEVRLAVVGCIALDWAALAFLDRADITHPGLEYPDGGKFTILGAERAAPPPAKLYCSSHTDRGAGYAFTGFGDNSGPRCGLPDALWLLEGLVQRASPDLPVETASALAALIRAQRPGIIDTAGAALAGAGPGAPSPDEDGIGAACRELLRALGYISDEGPQVLMLRADHWPFILQAVDQTFKLLIPWIHLNRQGIVDAASNTSPARAGVDPSMFFVELWHDVFGAANRILAEGGWFLNPAPPAPGQARYVTWCAETALYDRLQDWLRSGGPRAHYSL